MEFRFTRSLVKIILILLLVTFVVNLGLFFYSYSETVKIVESRLTDLTQMVATNNCLPREDGIYDAYKSLLAESETQFTRFSNYNGTEQLSDPNAYGSWGNKANVADWSFSVSSAHGRSLYSYTNPVQRNSPITCTVKARVICPFLFMPQVSIGSHRPIYVERTYTVVGQKFYKALPNRITLD